MRRRTEDDGPRFAPGNGWFRTKSCASFETSIKDPEVRPTPGSLIILFIESRSDRNTDEQTPAILFSEIKHLD